MTHFVVNRLSKRFRQGNANITALADLSLIFSRGHFSCVTGPSGSGKTTLLSVLSLLSTPDGGTVHFGEVDLTARSEKEREAFRRRNISMIFQNLRMVEVFTVREHIEQAALIGQAATIAASGIHLLEELGLADKISAFPAELSGGEKQRASLAISLCRNPAIVLADEPTASLDEENSIIVSRKLREYAESGAIVVCVSHDPIIFSAAHQVERLIKH